MDEPNIPKSASGNVDHEQGEPGTDSTVVFFGDPAQVGEGFAIALRAMGITATIADVTSTSRPNRENDHDSVLCPDAMSARLFFSAVGRSTRGGNP